jgi:glycosyltransferase involved in cell wall biosynthesis
VAGPAQRAADLHTGLTAAERFRAEYPDLQLPPVVVVVPAYDEEATVAAVVASVPATMAGLETKVVVVDDGSSDATGQRARAAGALVCRLTPNQGQGAALRAGYALAVEHGARFIATLDADGQWDAADLPALVAVASSGQADLVTGTRRGVPDPERRSLRGLGVVVFSAAFRVLTGTSISDPANGLRVMTAEVAARVRLDQAQFQASELLVSAYGRGFRLAEVPVNHHPRQAGVSKKGRNLSYGWRFSKALFGTYVREKGWKRRLGGRRAVR